MAFGHFFFSNRGVAIVLKNAAPHTHTRTHTHTHAHTHARGTQVVLSYNVRRLYAPPHTHTHTHIPTRPPLQPQSPSPPLSPRSGLASYKTHLFDTFEQRELISQSMLHPHHPLPPTPIIAVTANPSSPLALRSFTHRFGTCDRFTLLLLPPLAPFTLLTEARMRLSDRDPV
jgi:hypothetical protein